MSNVLERTTSRSVLVVEDDAVTRAEFAILLHSHGYAVSTARDGADALGQLKESRPGLILLDLMMPRMDGWEFRQRQRSDPALSSIPVVVVSATRDLQAQVTTLGAMAYLEKPIDADALMAAIEQYVAATFEILIVDDEDAVLKMLALALRRHGFVVRPCANGKDAVALYRQHGETIDVVLLDVQLRGSWDGPQTLAELLAIDPQVRACFMSGHTGRYSVEELLRMGAAGVFDKPFPSLVELAQKLRQVAKQE